MTIDITTTIATANPLPAFSTYAESLIHKYEQNPGVFLGMLVWYTVPESVWVEYNDFTALAIKEDAPVDIKKAPKASDVFLRACTTIENKFKKMPVPNINGNTDLDNSNPAYVNYLIRKAGSDSDWICKQLVVEYVDLSDHQLAFSVLADLRFHKHNHTMTIIPSYEGHQDPTVHQIYDGIKEYYQEREFFLTPYTIREAFRRALEGPMKGLSVRSAGGVYFVHASQGKNLKAMEMLANSVKGITFHMLPLIDDSNQREMLKYAFEDDSIGELERLMAEIQDVVAKKGKLTTKQLVAFQERYEEYRERTKEYKHILGDSLDTAAASLDLCKTQLKYAFTKVSD
jgi:hypothetical protein